MEKGLLIGIDGGGTHSTAVAAYPDGKIAAVAYGGGLNFHNVGVELVRQRMEDMVDELCRKTGCPAAKVCVGMSALDAPADETTLAKFTTGSLTGEQLDLQSDAYIALMGFTLGEPGVIVICGTGSMLLMMDKEGEQHASGGWGYLLADAGSSYTLAREGLLAVIDHAEGLGPATALTQDALAYFGAQTPRDLIPYVYAPDCTPDKLAGLARWVLQRAQEGDGPAYELLARNMARLARHAAHLIHRSPEAAQVGLYGGVFAHNPIAREMFAQALREQVGHVRVELLTCQPELGALIHLMKKGGLLTPEALETMKTSYEEYLK